MATTDNKFFTTMGRRGGSVGFVLAIPKDDNSSFDMCTTNVL
jgi:hypothetical protein